MHLALKSDVDLFAERAALVIGCATFLVADELILLAYFAL
jgi:hypothetical protein